MKVIFVIVFFFATVELRFPFCFCCTHVSYELLVLDDMVALLDSCLGRLTVHVYLVCHLFVDFELRVDGP